ncbi:MAG: sugar phosphate isomerase/epimerase [Deferribacterales bacterium]|nr:sugar phosphate isomerase/epimerase [Deferribacterales bacterium]
MRLSASNIAWSAENEREVLKYMQALCFCGLEIAPTKIIPVNPYDKNSEIKKYAENLKNNYNMTICSLQSVWYGISERISESPQSYDKLLRYTCKAMDFAKSVCCGNLVFGCPKNRKFFSQVEADLTENFVKDAADFAYKKGVTFALEANPIIYDTNFVNTTQEAVSLIRKLNCKGLKLNLDIGTMIYNNEPLDIVLNNIDIINHVHISEPMLKPIKKSSFHKELCQILKDNGYSGFISLEMAATDNIKDLYKSLDYISEAFS